MDALWQAVGRESFASSAQSNSARCRTCIEERSATCAVLPAKSCPGGLCSRSSIGTGYCHLIDLRCLHRTKRRRVKSEKRHIEHAPRRMLSRTRAPQPGGAAFLHAGAQLACMHALHALPHARPESPCSAQPLEHPTGHARTWHTAAAWQHPRLFAPGPHTARAQQRTTKHTEQGTLGSAFNAIHATTAQRQSYEDRLGRQKW